MPSKKGLLIYGIVSSLWNVIFMIFHLLFIIIRGPSIYMCYILYVCICIFILYIYIHLYALVGC